MSSTQSTTLISRSAAEPQTAIASSATLAPESEEKCSAPSSPTSESNWRPRSTRHVHCITDPTGRFLRLLDGDILWWTTDPLEAVESGHSWFSSTVASAALHRLREQMPDTELGLSLVVLRFRLGRWEVVSAEGFGVGSLSGQREVVA